MKMDEKNWWQSIVLVKHKTWLKVFSRSSTQSSQNQSSLTCKAPPTHPALQNSW